MQSICKNKINSLYEKKFFIMEIDLLTASRRRRSCSLCRWRSRSDTEFVNAGDIEFESDAGDEFVDLPCLAISSYGLCLRVVLFVSIWFVFNSSSSGIILPPCCFSKRCRCSCLRSCATFNCFSRFSFSLACLRNCSNVFSAFGKNPVFELLLPPPPLLLLPPLVVCCWLDQDVIDDFCCLLESPVGA